MEAMTVVLIGGTSTFGCIALDVGVFVLDPVQRHAAAWHPRGASLQHQETGARAGLGQC
jgi:hypothetical protein